MMSFTLAALAAAALPAVLDFARQNRGMVNGLLKESKPAIREVTQKVQDTVTGGDYEKAGWHLAGAGCLWRCYAPPDNKSCHGAMQAVYKYFRTYYGARTSLEKEPGGCYQVVCETEEILKAPGFREKVKNAAASVTGFDVRLAISFSENAGTMTVQYQEHVDDEILRVVKAVFVSNAVLGFCRLYGSAERHKIPFALDTVIQDYLNA